jgi:outer membrane protein assembly factor BamB
MKFSNTIFVLVLLMQCTASAQAATAKMEVTPKDWPMWRHDVGRTAATDEPLPNSLRLQWKHQMGSPKPAWPDENRMHFDMCYEPIVVGQTMFVGSNRSDSLAAFDTRSGKELWRFFADGPVRLAPAVWKQFIYFVSDDGFLYCLDAAQGGALVWKIRGGPDGQHLLGNSRLITEWPARGGPVIHEGIVYFGAGIWPSYGTFIRAVDAKTGKDIWTNEDADQFKPKLARKKHGTTGVAPHGHLAIVGGQLIVPNGRTMPGIFDLKSGAMVKFHPGHRVGNVFVNGMGDYYFVGGRMFHRETGLTMYNTVGKILHPPVITKEAIYSVRGDQGGRAKEISGRGGRTTDITIGEGLSNVDGRSGKNTLVCYHFSDVQPFEDDAQVLQEQHKGGDYQLNKILKKNNHVQRASIPWSTALPMDNVYLKAGNRLYGTIGNKLIAVELATGDKEAKTAWKIDAPGSVGSMIAADDRLIVSTTEGGIYCYGAKAGGATFLAGSPTKSKHPHTTQILKNAGVSDGYAIVLGAGDPLFLETLAARSSLHIIAVEKDSKKVMAARSYLHAAGLYGHRVHILQGDPMKYSLPAYMASLIVTDGDGKISDAVIKQHFNSLRPFGGMFCFKGSSASSQVSKAKKLQLGDVETKSAGDYQLLIRSAAVPGSGDWTQSDADAGNRMSSDDTLVKMPLRVLWFGGESDAIKYINHNAMPPRPQVVGGRMFLSTVGGMSAIDIYTGRVLWQTSIEKLADTYGWLGRAKGVRVMGDFYASTADSVYAASNTKCYRLDAADGKIIGTFTLPKPSDGKELVWTSIRTANNYLIATATYHHSIKLNKNTAGESQMRGSASSFIMVFDRISGKLKWKTKADQAFSHISLAAGGNKVFCVDRMPEEVIKYFKTMGSDKAIAPAVLKAFDMSSGKQLWTVKDKVFGGYLRYSEHADVLASCTIAKKGSVQCYDGGSGKLLWKGSMGRSPGKGVILFKDTLAMAGFIFSLKDGAKKGRAGITDNMSCTDVTAGANISVMRLGGTFGFTPMKNGEAGGKAKQFTGTRPACHNNVIPAGGVLTAPNVAASCICNYHNQTSMAFIHVPSKKDK